MLNFRQKVYIFHKVAAGLPAVPAGSEQQFADQELDQRIVALMQQTGASPQDIDLMAEMDPQFAGMLMEPSEDFTKIVKRYNRKKELLSMRQMMGDEIQDLEQRLARMSGGGQQ